MSKINQTTILEKTAELFASSGNEKFSIRKLAKLINITPSVIYHYFINEEVLLRSMYDFLNIRLGQKRKLLPMPSTADKMLKQRIEFQLDNSQDIVAVLKYFFANRKNFPKFKKGFVPDKSSLHIEEVLRFGVNTREFVVDNIEDDAKVITHAINGFLLEYYPYKPEGAEKRDLINRIYKFIIKAVKGGKKMGNSVPALS